MNETQDTVIEKASNRYDNVMIISMLTSGKRLGYYSSLQIRKLPSFRATLPGSQLALLTPGKLPEISERRWEWGAGGQGSATGEQEESRDPGTCTGKSGRGANPGHVAPEFPLLRAPNLWTWATLWRKGSQLCLLFTS